MLNPISFKTSQIIKDLLSRIENKYDADCLYINGPIEPGLLSIAREFVTLLKKKVKNRDYVCC